MRPKKRKCPLLTVGAVELSYDGQLSLFDNRIIVTMDWKLENGKNAVLELPRELYFPENKCMRVYRAKFDRGLSVGVAEIAHWNGSEWEYTYVDAKSLEPNGGVFTYYVNLFTDWKKWSDKEAYKAAYDKRLNIMIEALKNKYDDLFY